MTRAAPLTRVAFDASFDPPAPVLPVRISGLDEHDPAAMLRMLDAREGGNAGRDDSQDQRQTRSSRGRGRQQADDPTQGDGGGSPGDMDFDDDVPFG